MLNYFLQPWPWYVGGPLIALVMFLLVWTGKSFGMSSNLRTLCSAMGAGEKVPFFRFEWKRQSWNLAVAAGTIVGGFIASQFLSSTTVVALSIDTIEKLHALGFTDAGKSFVPESLFGVEVLSKPKSWFLLGIGGFLIGFGARYAGGCTSGHAISGLSNFQWPSLIAVIGFFIGGLFMNHFILPFLF